MNDSPETPGADGGPRELIERLKPEILEAIAEHLRVRGPADWHLIRDNPRFAAVIGAASGAAGARRFWRWRKIMGAELPPDRTRPREGRQINEGYRAWANEEARRAAETMPAPPQASFFMARGASGVETVRIFNATTEAWSDLLEAKALIEQSDQKPHVKAKLLAENARARINAMLAVTKILERTHNIDALHQRYRQLFSFVMEECGGYPDLQDKFLGLAEQLNAGQLPPTPPVR